jgi:hypothetical protein
MLKRSKLVRFSRIRLPISSIMLKINRINETRGEHGTKEIQREKTRSAHLNTDTLHYLPDVGLMCNYKRVQLTLY